MELNKNKKVVLSFRLRTTFLFLFMNLPRYSLFVIPEADKLPVMQLQN